MPQISRTKRVLNFLAPTSIGMVWYFVAYFFIVLGPFLPGFQSIFRDVGNLQGSWLYDIGHDVNKFLSQGFFGRLALFIFWAAVGIGLLLGGHLASSEASELSEAINERGYVTPAGSDKNRALREFVERLAARIAVLVFAIAYLRFVIHVIKSWEQAHRTIGNITTHLIESYALLLLATLLLFHGLVLVIRLLLLRRRVFSSTS